jgi:hypothetical protein
MLRWTRDSKLMLAAAALALFAPAVAKAHSIDHTKQMVDGMDTALLTFDNRGGSAGTKTAGGPFILQNSSVYSFDGHSFTGHLNFQTGNFIASSGSLATGGMFAGGGSFTIVEQGMGVIFTGSFSGNVQWIFDGVSAQTGQYSYTLTGPISGMYNGQFVSGATTQLNFTTGSSPYTGGFGTASIKDTGGSTTFPATVPEPGSLGLMGTGLLGIAAVLKRKLKSSRSSQQTSI